MELSYKELVSIQQLMEQPVITCKTINCFNLFNQKTVCDLLQSNF